MRILILLLLASSLSAQVLRQEIALKRFEGAAGFTCFEMAPLLDEVKKIYREQLDVRLVWKYGACRNDVIINSIDEIRTTYYMYLERFEDRKRPTLVITSPVWDDRTIYIGGLGSKKYFMGWVFVGPFKWKGVERNDLNVLIMAHDLGHALGAEHDEDVTSIMNTRATYLAAEGAELKFNLKAKRDIRRFIRKF